MINILMAGNTKVFDGILIAVLSIIKHCEKPINLYILTMDLRDMDPSYAPITLEQTQFVDSVLKTKNRESLAIRIDITQEYIKEMKNSPNNFDIYTPYAFLRLFADRVDCLPSKVLYLDTDVVALKDIEELYNIDVTNYEFAGALDYYGRWFYNPRYVNSGVMLLNIDNIRKSGLFKRTLNLCARRKIFLADQTSLNRLCKNKLIIDRKYNEQKKVKEDTVIRHFSKTIKFFPYFHTQNIKPWNVEEVMAITKNNDLGEVLKDYQNIIKDFNMNHEIV